MSPSCVTAWANTFAFLVKQQFDIEGLEESLAGKA
jgi:hypothetical protein